jgi:hypothetical protein
VDPPSPYTPYTVLFIAASLSGAIDVLLFLKVPEPPIQERTEPPRLRDLIRIPFRNENFKRFLVYSALASLGFNIIGPSLWLFALETLKMGKFWANLTLMIAHMVAIAIFSGMWGRLIDRYGNRPVLRLTALALAFFPVPWLLAEPSSWRWLVINGFVAGMFWSGLELANFNLLLGLFPRENKSIYLAAYSVIVGAVAGLAPVIGGIVLEPLKGAARARWSLGACELQNCIPGRLCSKALHSAGGASHASGVGSQSNANDAQRNLRGMARKF